MASTMRSHILSSILIAFFSISARAQTSLRNTTIGCMDPRVRYSGNWLAPSNSASDDHEPYALGITADAVARINFVGNTAHFVAPMFYENIAVGVSMDGQKQIIYLSSRDSTNPTANQPPQPLTEPQILHSWTLSQGAHTLEVFTPPAALFAVFDKLLVTENYETTSTSPPPPPPTPVLTDATSSSQLLSQPSNAPANDLSSSSPRSLPKKTLAIVIALTAIAVMAAFTLSYIIYRCRRQKQLKVYRDQVRSKEPKPFDPSPTPHRANDHTFLSHSTLTTDIESSRASMAPYARTIPGTLPLAANHDPSTQGPLTPSSRIYDECSQILVRPDIHSTPSLVASSSSNGQRSRGATVTRSESESISCSGSARAPKQDEPLDEVPKKNGLVELSYDTWDVGSLPPPAYTLR